MPTAINTSLIDDCFNHDKDRLKHDEALDILKNRMAPIVGTETLPCHLALDRVLANHINAPHDVPLHRNSAVDGYAFSHADLADTPLPVSGRIAAGDLSPPPLKNGTTVRIFTGAPMPPGADTIAMQEDCTFSEDGINLPVGLKAGANCRLAGEDLKQNEQVLSQGTTIKAADLAAVASIGTASLPVYQKLKVALLSTGNELRFPEDDARPLAPGEVYDANQPLILALSARLPVDLSYVGIIPDDAKCALERIEEISADYDVIITTGGASKGTEDHMLSTLDQLGKRHLWQLAVKPGRPMMFGQITRPGEQPDCLFFGLPGNPVAAMVCFSLYVSPALRRLAGAQWLTPHRYQIPSGFSILTKKPDRREFLRGHLTIGATGRTIVNKYPRDGSGLISSLRESDGLIEIPEETIRLDEGELVSFIPFSGF